MSIILLKLPIMLLSNSPKFSLLCSNYAPLCSTTSLIIPKLHNLIIMSINSLSSSSTVLTIYLHTHINTLNSLLLHFTTLVNTYLTKSLPHINPNLIILGKTCFLYNFFPLCWQFLPVMLALCSVLLPPYYAQNYASIIGSSLLVIHS